MNPHLLQIEREMHGWSLAKVAEAVGTTPDTVLRWEQGQDGALSLLPGTALCALRQNGPRPGPAGGA